MVPTVETSSQARQSSSLKDALYGEIDGIGARLYSVIIRQRCSPLRRQFHFTIQAYLSPSIKDATSRYLEITGQLRLSPLAYPLIDHKQLLLEPTITQYTNGQDVLG